MTYQEINAATIDRWIEEGWEWGTPISHEEYEAAAKGNWEVKLTDEEQRKQLEQEDAGMQFSHTLEEQIGGQLEAGFTLLDLYEDTNGEGRLHELNIPTFLAMRSRK